MRSALGACSVDGAALLSVELGAAELSLVDDDGVELDGVVVDDCGIVFWVALGLVVEDCGVVLSVELGLVVDDGLCICVD